MSWGGEQREIILKKLASDIRWAYKPYLADHEQLGDLIDSCIDELTDVCIYEILTQYGLDEAYSETYNSVPRPTIRHVMYVLYDKAWLLYKDVPHAQG